MSSTKEADETKKKLKWRQALRIATQNPDRWTTKAAEWNPKLIISTKTQRRAGRPAKRWEDHLNDIVKDEETEATQSNDPKNNSTRLVTAKKEHLQMVKERKTRRQTRYRRLRNPTELKQQQDMTSKNITTPATATSQ